jgi:hemoglobin-like flavoprotein
MTPSQILAVKESFAMVEPIADEAGAMFYARLFELNPGLRPLFKGDIAEQSRKLMQVLTAAVNALDRIETIVPAVEALGARHVGYGVEDAHYDTVAAALLWTLERGLGDHFAPSVRDAWIAAYTLLAQTMKAAAHGEAARATAT